MIARSPTLPAPIPFRDPLHSATSPATRAVRWSPLPGAEPSPQPITQGHASLTPMRTLARAQVSTVATDAAPRQATVRYDGPHALSIRSSATGRHYRFAQTGAVEVIDAADLALMRRIDDITVL